MFKKKHFVCVINGFNSLSVCRPRNALLAPVVLHVGREPKDVAAPEFLARHQIGVCSQMTEVIVQPSR